MVETILNYISEHREHLVAVLATQLTLTLYGAGIRRPFGSLSTITFLPNWLRNAHSATLCADIAFVVFILFMWWQLALELGWIPFLILAWLFASIGEYLSNRITLVPSAVIAFGLAVLALVLLNQPA